MLSIFRLYNLCKYVETPYVPPIDSLHPTMDEELDLLRNLRIVNLIIRGLPDNLLELVTNFECAYSMWKFLEELYPNYSLRGLDEILHKTIEFDRMHPNDPNFDKCFFELRDLMRKKGDTGLISIIIRNALILHSIDYCHIDKTNAKSDQIDLGVDDEQSMGQYDDEHEYDDEYSNSDTEQDKIMKSLNLMAKL